MSKIATDAHRVVVDRSKGVRRRNREHNVDGETRKLRGCTGSKEVDCVYSLEAGGCMKPETGESESASRVGELRDEISSGVGRSAGETMGYEMVSATNA